jgi:lipopolysaccharide/colanic/teichoic acid biosynthesis glycosyltransferase
MMGVAQALDAVLDAASECAVTVPHARFVLVGGGIDRDRLERRARELKLANVEFVPMQPLSAIRAIFDEADALLVHLKDAPLFTITIPCKTQAYLAAGRPVIMAVAGDAADLVMRAGAGVLAKPQNADSVAEAVRWMASQPTQERERMGAAGRAFYEKELSIEVAVDKFQKIFDRLAGQRRDGAVRFTKSLNRAMDIVGAATALCLFAPIMALAALTIRLKMGLSPFFKQERPGLNERPFTLLKLRTMNQAADATGALLPDSERLTGLGRLLRTTSLDEVPQFWNVLCGDMSLVGPRPLRAEYLPRYTAFQRRRHEVKPGITGWAQVNGRNVLTWERKFELDVWYIDHQSLWLDVKILLLTLLCVFRRQGINQSGYATMPEFQGTERR